MYTLVRGHRQTTGSGFSRTLLIGLYNLHVTTDIQMNIQSCCQHKRTKRKIEGNIHSALCMCKLVLITQRSQTALVNVAQGSPTNVSQGGHWFERKGMPTSHDIMFPYIFFPSFIMAKSWNTGLFQCPLSVRFHMGCVSMCVCVFVCFPCNVMRGLCLQLTVLAATLGAETDWDKLSRHQGFKNGICKPAEKPKPHKPQLQMLFVGFVAP